MIDTHTLRAELQAQLTQARPPATLDRAIAGAGLALAVIPAVVPLDAWSQDRLALLAAPVLAVYWLAQLRVMQTGVWLAAHGRAIEALHLAAGFALPRDVLAARARAAVVHHRWLIGLVCVPLLSLSLAVTGFYYFRVPDWNQRGVLTYVGIVSSGYIGFQASFPYLKWPASLIPAAAILLALAVTNSLISAIVGLWARRLDRAIALRLAILAVALVAFAALFALRSTPAWTCWRSWMIPDRCDAVITQQRLVDSIQALLLSWSDGGMALSTGMHLPMGSSPTPELYQLRYFLAGLVTIGSQVVLYLALLARAARMAGVSSSARSDPPARR